jgi:hypothetical protein
MRRRLALALAAVVSSSAAPPCEWSGALPNAYVGAALGAASFATAAEAMAACNAAANCTGVTSQQGAAPPWGMRVGQVQGGTPGTGSVVSFAMTNAVACGHVPLPLQVGFHNASFDAAGNLLPPAFFNFSVQLALDASVAFYSSAPLRLFSHGLPPWVWSTFTNGDYEPTSTDIVAAFSNGLGILGYVKYHERAAAGRGGAGANASAALQGATWLADYLVSWALTRPEGAWPSVARSTGVNTDWPLNRSAQHDANSGPDCIETDKVGIVGYALLKLHEAVAEPPGGPYLAAALHHARVLAANQRPGNATDAPWPWRVDSVSGASLWGRKNANMVYILRLFRAFAAPPYGLDAEFGPPAAALWQWVETVLLPAADPAIPALDSPWVNLYEDRPFNYSVEVDRTSWPALMLANFLIEERDSGLDPQWQLHVERLVDYALTLFGHIMYGNVTLTGEQDDDNRGWGGAGSKLGGVLARWACAGGPAWARAMAVNNMAHIAYYSDLDGCRTDAAWFPAVRSGRGGWTQDCWLDVLHSVVDGLEALDGVCGGG